MFETSKPISSAFGHGNVEADSWPVDAEPLSPAARGGDALRAIAWSELTARLNAARELRHELREEAILCAGASGATFGDAAANFFKTFGDGERPVNPEALEGCKASGDISQDNTGVSADGEARDEL